MTVDDLQRRQQRFRRVAADHERAPGDPQRHTECRGVRAVAGDVADHGVHGAVGGLDRVVEVAAEQRAAPARAVVRGEDEMLVVDQRRRQQAALEAGVLLRVQARDLELAARLVRAQALDRVVHGAGQTLAVDLALDQVVLRARADGFHPAALVVEPGEDEHRDVRAVGLEPVQPGQALRVRQVQVQQHAVDLGQVLAPRLGERRHPDDLHVRAADVEQLLDEQRVAVVVLDEQQPDRAGGRRGVARSPVDGLWRSQDEWVTARRPPHSTQPPEASVPVPGRQGTAVACSGW